MSRMHFNFHPAGKQDEPYSKYFVVSPDGKWELRTYSKAAPGGVKPPSPSYAGGDGSSFERAVIVTAATEDAGVDAEHVYLDRHFPGSKRESQAFVNREKRVFDILRFTDKTGQKRTIYFDVTSFFGKWDGL